MDSSFAEILKHMPYGSGPRIGFEYTWASSHERRVELVEQAVDLSIEEYVKSKQHKQKRNEDEITVDLVGNLVCMGIPATHDTQYGGHVDVVIQGPLGFMWMGEAKIHKSYNWLLSGFDQLLGRYSTGMKGHNVGAIIIYCYNEKALPVLQEWHNHLSSNRDYVKIDDCPKDRLEFRSHHEHQASGLLYIVRHQIVPMLFKPSV